jgi:formylglycine-generating enzyme required for sulfatase activity
MWAVLLQAPCGASSLVEVEGGTYQPILFKGKMVKVESFRIFETAVTNREYLDFVLSHAKWQRSKVKRLFADDKYLSKWKSDSDFGDQVLADAPVVHVSWSAAQAYCEAQNLRLPTLDEWEYIAQFGPNQASGKEAGEADPKEIILSWYSKPNPERVPAVRSTFKNKFGAWDVHGLIWEWVYDFNSAFVTGESRGDTSLEKSMFCGAGSVGAADPTNYAAFMRFSFRSSLKGNYTVANLGFRCATILKGGNTK